MDLPLPTDLLQQTGMVYLWFITGFMFLFSFKCLVLKCFVCICHFI